MVVLLAPRRSPLQRRGLSVWTILWHRTMPSQRAPNQVTHAKATGGSVLVHEDGLSRVDDLARCPNDPLGRRVALGTPRSPARACRSRCCRTLHSAFSGTTAVSSVSTARTSQLVYEEQIVNKLLTRLCLRPTMHADCAARAFPAKENRAI
jgi:hypothetical protein